MVAINEKTTRNGNNGNGFRKGVSGNPKGRPKQTKEQKDALAAMRDMAPEAVEWMTTQLRDPRAPQDIVLKICKEILDRTYGKAEASVRISVQDFSALDDAFAAIRDDDLK